MSVLLRIPPAAAAGVGLTTLVLGLVLAFPRPTLAPAHEPSADPPAIDAPPGGPAEVGPQRLAAGLRAEYRAIKREQERMREAAPTGRLTDDPEYSWLDRRRIAVVREYVLLRAAHPGMPLIGEPES